MSSSIERNCNGNGLNGEDPVNKDGRRTTFQETKASEELGGSTTTEAPVPPKVQGKKVSAPAASPHDAVFPPPASWYQAHIGSSRPNMWAYIAQNAIVVAKEKNGNSKSMGSLGVPAAENLEANSSVWPNFIFLNAEKNEKFTSISFCQEPDWEMLPVKDVPLVTASDSGLVRLWNLETKETASFHDYHKGRAPVVAEWSPTEPSLVYSVDSMGHFTMWDVKLLKIFGFDLGKLIPTCIAGSPHEERIVAIGTRSGHVMIIEAKGKGKILYKLRHDEEVFSLAWKPQGHWGVVPEMKMKNFTEPFIAASISSLKPGPIRVWDRKGKEVALIYPWEKPREHKISKTFIPITWRNDPNSGELSLISAGKDGEIIAWSESSTTPNHIHKIHKNYTIFTIFCCGDTLWSLSHEPVIVGFNLRSGSLHNIIPTFRGVSSIIPSPADFSRMAFGGADNYIRILTIGRGYPHEASTKAPSVTTRLKGKINALAWHPRKDKMLGLGTDEGVFGTYEWRADNRYALMFDRRVDGPIYTVDWGPKVYEEGFEAPKHLDSSGQNEKASDEYLMLYVCGGKRVYSVSPSKQSNALISVSKIIQGTNTPKKTGDESRGSILEGVSDCKWSPDLAYLAIGYQDGRVELYTPPHLKLRCWIKCHSRAIQFLTWRIHDFNSQYGAGNPDDVVNCFEGNSNSTGQSLVRYFASSSNDGTARVFNLAKLYDPEFMKSENGEVEQVISSLCTLNGHGSFRVISLAWSPHDNDIIVTVSYDRTAVIWNIKTGEKVSRYVGHQHRLVACSFHPMDPYKVITSSDEMGLDFSVHVWDYREHPYTDTIPKCSVFWNLSSNKALKAELQGPMEPATDTQPEGKSITSSNVYVVGDKTEKRHDTQGAQRSTKHKKPQSILPLTSNALINTKGTLGSELKYIVEKVPLPDAASAVSEVKVNPAIHLAVLGSQDDCLDMIRAEREGHLASGSWENFTLLSNWLEDPLPAIQQAVKSGNVTESVVILASSQSKAIYTSTVTAYAKQLDKRDDYHKAAHYYVLIDLIEEAAQVYAKRKMFREALVIAKSRLGEDAPIVKEIQENWLEQLSSDGNFELACKIYCSMGRYAEALSLIERRNLPYAWKASLYLASKGPELTHGTMLGIKFLEDAMQKGNYTECVQLVKEFPFVKWMELIVVVHQQVASLPSARDPNNFVQGLAGFKNLVEKSWSSRGLEDQTFKEKIKTFHVSAIPQNKTEAQLIVCKYFTLMMLEEEDKMTRKEESIRLSKTWFEESTDWIREKYIALAEHLGSTSTQHLA